MNLDNLWRGFDIRIGRAAGEKSIKVFQRLRLRQKGLRCRPGSFTWKSLQGGWSQLVETGADPSEMKTKGQYYKIFHSPAAISP